jgi:hypothetical protein
MANFGGGQGDERQRGRGFLGDRAKRARLRGDADQEGVGEQNQGDVTSPAGVATHFILIQAQLFTGLQVLFDVPARANGLHDGGQGGGKRCEDQVIRQFVGIVKAAADHQEVASILGPSLHPRQHRPIKEAFTLGALTLTEAPPGASAQLVGDAAHVSEQAARVALHTDGFGAGDGQRVEEALCFQEGAQIRAVAVHGIGDDPAADWAR